MGRDVVGSHTSSVKTKRNGVSHDAVRGIYCKTSRETSHAKPTLVKEGTIKAAAHANSNEKYDVLGLKSPPFEDVKNDISTKVEETKSASPENSGLEETSVENVQTKHIVEKPLDATGDQLARPTPLAAVTPALCGNTSPNANILQSPSSSKKSQLKTPFVSRKILDDEDNWSMASSTTASVRTTRSRTTVGVAPKFSVTERLEKRKEFYEKLEEKHKALEAEKLEYEARNKEEEQSAIKQLRKSMTYKANPVPNFYYEGPPPKKELKKLPTTRAVSPKFARRKSCGDALRSPSEEKVASSRPIRHSLGNLNQNHKLQKQGYVTPTKTASKTKGLLNKQSRVKPSSKELPSQSPKGKEPEPASAIPQNMAELANTDISVQS